MPQESQCQCKKTEIPAAKKDVSALKGKQYIAALVAAAAAWCAAYINILPASSWLVTNVFGLSRDSHPGSALEFFIYDTAKILLLLIALIYVIAWLRASLNLERVRDFLAGKGRSTGYVLGALFGSVTPFCSCSSIPLFLGFATAGIPFGITMAFLITSPLINEIAVVLLWGLLGWKFTVVYVAVGLSCGIIGGFIMDAIHAERWLQPYFLELISNPPVIQRDEQGNSLKLTVQQRHLFAYGEMRSIFKRVWKWVIAGVALGAAIHGFVPEDWFAAHLGAGEWWSVPAAVLVAIPLYSNVTGIVPVMESLLLKGLPIGTTLAFCMSAVAASIPEVMLLRQIMTVRLQGVFIFYLWVIFTLTGWIFNACGAWLR